MAKKIITIVLLISGSILCKGQFDADSVFIYKDYNYFGTTAALIINHQELDSLNAPKIKLNSTDLQYLKDIFKDRKKTKFFQQKHGRDIYYMIVWNDNKKYDSIIESSEEFGRIINLTLMKQWKLKDMDKIKELNAFVSKNLL